MVVPVVVDEKDVCFFDHPLDHVPGMVLVAGVLDFVGARAPEQLDADGGRLRLTMSFDRMCELGSPVWLSGGPIAADDGPAWELAALQDGEAVSRATIRLGGTPSPLRTGREAAVPADPGLVHRHRPENVLLGGAVRVERAAVLVPPTGHRLAGGGVHTPGALVESARQMATMLGHTAHGRDVDAQMLWLSLEADLPTGLPIEVPLELRWEFAPARGARAVYGFAVVDAESGEGYGRMQIGVHTLSRAGYLKRRSAK
ncbi:AfsA-related hotdog domain-containing protein [Kitasatospora sp. NPDC089913]|uniref:AfsA-related hotdog domain-containing protein n=1 Tax=Streptomycetaceae TaxID=2062 RepID=UPI000B867B40|nr:AfsA-related hotdog domain-containing protein [Streptomyces sp. TLI_053]